MFFKLFEFLNKKKNFPYYFISPLFYSYGNAAEQIYLTSCEKFLRNKKIVILNYTYFQKFLKFKISNKYLISGLVVNNQDQKKNRYYLSILNFLVSLEFFFRRILILYFYDLFKIPSDELKRFPFIGLKNLHSYNSNYKFEDVEKLDLSQSRISLNSLLINKCEKFINIYNPNNKKIVTLHVRDSKYKNDSLRRNYRNSDINNYIDLIKFLIDKEYIVFRLGMTPCNKINFKHQDFIDYPELNCTSPILDLYLIKQSEFFIGTGSGPRAVAEMFSKPILITNNDDFSDMPLKKTDRTLFKKFILRKSNKFFSIDEIFNSDHNLFDPELYLDNFILKENTNEEILDAGKEFLSNLSNKNFELTNDQVKFNKVLKNKIHHFYTKKDNNTLKFHVDTLRYIKRSKSMEGSICQTSLNI